MQKLSIPAFSYATKTYCLLTKPGIIFGNLITTAGGFALASKGRLDGFLLLMTVIGLCFVIGSACVFNNYIDRESDKKMVRTQNRALVTGKISLLSALIFAIILGMIGSSVLLIFTNPLTFAIAFSGFLIYVLLYSFSKYKSIHGTLIGSVAGALPPVAGYCAVSNQLDAGAWILFSILIFWQMPHFFAIGIYRLADYIKASIPIVPVKKGVGQTKIQMLFYVIAFIIAAAMLAVVYPMGYVYLGLTALLGLLWLSLCIQGFTCQNNVRWARHMFIFSLIAVMTLFSSFFFITPIA